MSEWIKCSDRLPELKVTEDSGYLSIDVLVTDGINVCQGSYSAGSYICGIGVMKWAEFTGGFGFEPTHWAPLPTPPEAE